MTQENKITIIELLSFGLSTEEISDIMECNLRTLESVIGKLVKEYKCKNRTELVAYFLRKKLIK